MTITYQFNVATSAFFGFTKLLLKWRGSVYKLVYKELMLYMTAFGLISFSYRVLMTKEQRSIFEKISQHCAKYLDLIPLAFVLGFYVTYIVQRWWSQFTTIPWPDRLMNTIILYVDGADERGRMIRRTLMRYWNLSFVMILSSISIAVKKRFPTLDHIVEAGFMTAEEQQYFNQIQAKINKYFVPMCWFLRLLDQAKKEGRVKEGAPLKHILEELNDTRSKMSLLWCHDWVTMPLVYTQVVTWATHLFFVACLVGRQFLDPTKKIANNDIDLYIPVFTLLQFFFYMGWLKVAEQLINPFGEDDDDFETNWLIDRHIQVCYLGVDELYTKTPPMEKDRYWDNKEPDLPYTPATLIHRIPTYSGSTMHLKFPEKDQPLLHADSMHQDFPPMPPKSIITRIKEFFSCGEPRPFTFNSMWRESVIQSESDLRKNSKGMNVRTLGRKESLMADHYLAMLNSGQKRWILEHANSHPSAVFHYDTNVQVSYNEVPDPVPLMERRANRSKLMRQESIESSLSFRAGSSLSIKHDDPNNRHNRYSLMSDGDDDEIAHPFLDDVGKAHPLTRLSEVENETDGDYSNTASPMETPTNSPFHSMGNTAGNPEKKDSHVVDMEKNETTAK